MTDYLLNLRVENLVDYLVTHIIPGLLISVAAAFVTVRLSLGRFRTERWWERKADSYTLIIKALHHMKEHCIKELRTLEYGTELSEETTKELGAKSKEGFEQISMATDIGSFIISNEAVDCLKDFQKKSQGIEFGNDVYGYFDSQAAIVKECLNSIREIAKRDLGLD